MDVFDLMAKLSLDSDDYDKKLNNAESKAGKAGKIIGGAFAGASAAIGAIGTAAIGAGATAVGALTKSAVESYASYEQLVGGVDTLFGKSSQKVQEYANRAYETAGMSANDYMETVTSFSASLLQGLGGDTKKAANVADQAIVDMSDNANKMGTSMEMIQNAYQGFAKQNYTMLDNLKLGYGGTASEMARLVKDSGVLGAAADDLTAKNLNQKVSFDQIIEAIHVTQDRMKITGTTAKEASTTIEGSVNSMKAAWQNLMTGLANPDADLSGMIDTLVQSVATVGENLMPVIEQTLSGIGTLLDELAPMIAEKLPGIIESVAPSLLSSASTLIPAVMDSIEIILGALTSNSQMIVDAGLEIISSLGNGILNALPQLATIAAELLTTIVDSLSGDGLSKIGDVIMQVFETLSSAIIDNLPAILSLGMELLQSLSEGLIQALPVLAESAVEMITQLANFIVENLPTFIETGLQMLMALSESLRTNIGLIIDAGIQLLLGLAQGLIDALPVMIETIPTIIDNIVNIVNDNAPKLLVAGVQIIIALAKGLIKAIPTLIKEIPKIIKTIWDTITAINWISLGAKIVTGIANGIKSLFGNIAETAKSLVSKITDGGGLKNLPKMALEWGRDMIMNFIGGIKNKIANLVSTIKGVAKKIKDLIGFSEPKEGPLSNFHTFAPDMMDLFMQGVKDNEKKLQNQIADTFDFGEVGVISSKNITTNKSAYNKWNYEALGDAIANSLSKSNMAIKIGEREFGRVVRSAVNYG
jgi:phage-related protein